MNDAVSTALFLGLFLTFALGGCAPLSPSGYSAGTSLDGFDELKKTDAEEYLEPAEPEELLREELAALDRTGSWDNAQICPRPEQEEKRLFDFPITLNRQVQFYLDTFQHRQKKYFRRWLARSGRYLPMIEQELQRAGLPRDLAYLAMIESGFNPSAYSRARAVGLWQFIRGTGRNYGLRIDSWVDERRNPEKATRAAIRYLSDLYEEFGDWYLAVAAYNAGEGKIRKAIKRYKTRDFWQLARHRYLRLETKRYVPKLIAAIMIARQPHKYGFDDIAYQTPQATDRVEVPAGIDLAAVAAAASTDVRTIRTLNNELRRSQTPPRPGRYVIQVPAGQGPRLAARLKRLHPVVATEIRVHTVRQGETLQKICRTYRLNTKTLVRVNRLRSTVLRPGQRLKIPYRTTRYVLLKEGESLSASYAAAGKRNPLILHRLKKGETLSKLSRHYGVPVSLIRQWNGIDDVRKIRAGDHLALYIEQAASRAVRPVPKQAMATSSVSVPVLRDSKKVRVASAGKRSPSASYTSYRVRRGDSLWTIARKFNVSARDLRKWNRLRSNLIHPGTHLVIRKG